MTQKTITLSCGSCGVVFQRKARSELGKVNYCSRFCQDEGQRTTSKILRRCKQCGVMFRLKYKEQKFCGMSCSATFNNAKRLKKPKAPTPVKEKVKQGDDYTVVTIKGLRDRTGTRNFHTRIRTHARTVYEQSGLPMACCACGYPRGVDICHIKPVSEFPDSATIAEVNALCNLVALDKLCHWEFDHGFLEFDCE